MQRWSLFFGDGRHSTGMAGDPDGAFVEFTDYDTLRAQLEAAETFHQATVLTMDEIATELRRLIDVEEAGRLKAEARAEAAEAECERLKQVDANMVSRVANALTLAGWDIDPDDNGTGYAELEAALIWARTKEETK